MKNNAKTLMGILLASTMLLTACGGSGSNSTASGSGASGEPASKGMKDTLIVATATEPKNLEAYGATDSGTSVFKSQIYDTLFNQDDQRNIIPNIATEWKFEDDTTLTIKVRDDVKFHNGEAMDASDVLYSIKRGSESDFTKWMVADIDVAASKVIDPTTVQVKMTQANGAVLANLSFLYITDEKTFTDLGDEKLAENPVGSGPYMYKDWVRGDRVEFVRNDNYWGDKALTEKIILRAISEPANRAIEVESGGVDIALKITAANIPNLESNKNAVLIREPGFGNNFVGFNCAEGPFTDPLLRQAVSYAVDKASIVKAVYGGTGTASTGPLPSSVWGYTKDVPSYDLDLEKAKLFLTEAGYPDGIDIVITTSDSQTRMDIAEILQNQLGKANIRVKVETLENSTYLDKIINGGFQMYILGWTTNTGDADYGMYETFYTGQPTWSNTARYSNTEVDKLLDIGRRSTNSDERLKAYAEAQKLIVQDAPWIFLWDSEEIAATTTKVQNFKLSPSDRHEFSKVSVEK